jgi:hypothetical protein
MDLTRVMEGAYNQLRRAVMAQETTLAFFDDNGELVAEIRSGWYPETIEGNSTGRQVSQVRVLELGTPIDLDRVTFLEYGGCRYEQEGFPDPPTGNPREYIWRLRPVGVVEERTWLN